MMVGSESRNKDGNSSLFITSVKISSKVLKFPFNIHRCLKENFGGKKMQICSW